MEWYLKVLRQYADFNGRARRKEYWLFALFNFLFSVLASIFDLVLNLQPPDADTGPIAGLYALVIIVPSLAVTVRRLHDVGKSGWMFFIVFIPIVGFFWMLYLLTLEGDAHDNEFGPDPKQEDVII